MPTVNVILVRAVENAALVRAQRHVLDIEFARRQQLRRAALQRDRVEMIPAVFLARENDPIYTRELQ